MRLTSATFTSSGSWTCPAGVTQVIVFAQGGGGQGSDGSLGGGGAGGSGGKSTFLVPVLLTVVPNTTYTITIGTGGTGSVILGGGNTYFGGLQTWLGAASGFQNIPGYSTVYSSDPSNPNSSTVWNNPISVPGGIGGGILPSSPAGNAIAYGNYAARGSNRGSGGGGGGGGGNSSDAGIGGAGGSGAPAGGGAGAGNNAPSDSYGAGGGGGGGANTGTPAPGGEGAGGRMIIVWME